MTETIIAEEGGERLDVFLAGETEYTRSFIKQLIDRGRVLVNGGRVKGGSVVRPLDEITLDVPEEVSEVRPENLPLDILYEDGDIVVVNKARGMTVHPAPGNYEGTLVSALLYHVKDLSTINGVIRPGIVHRLDKNTTGVMVAAKNDRAHLALSRQFAARTAKKEYEAILEGNLPDEAGRIETKIGRSRADRKRMAVTPDGRDAVTLYRVAERFARNCRVEFELLTGRTHQIRVHCKHLGHPVVGDPEYGVKKQRFSLAGQLLHSKRLTLTHPATGEEMTFSAGLPADYLRVLEILRREPK